jgi:hypothetical protein
LRSEEERRGETRLEGEGKEREREKARARARERKRARERGREIMRCWVGRETGPARTKEGKREKITTTITTTREIQDATERERERERERGREGERAQETAAGATRAEGRNRERDKNDGEKRSDSRFRGPSLSPSPMSRSLLARQRRNELRGEEGGRKTGAAAEERRSAKGERERGSHK